MIRNILRSFGAVFAGLIVAMVLVMVIEGIGAVVHPFPAESDTSEFDVVANHVEKCPQWFLAVAVLLWGGTTFVGTWIANRLGTGRHPGHGFVVGLLIVLAAASNVVMLPYPIWFKIVTLVVLPICVVAAVRIGRVTESD